MREIHNRRKINWNIIKKSWISSSWCNNLHNHRIFNETHIRIKISTETICLVALLRLGLLRASFSVAILFPWADSRRRISLEKEAFASTSSTLCFCRDGISLCTTLHHRAFLLSSLNPFYSRFVLLSVPPLSTTTLAASVIM